ncbi:MAG: hypothetical protein ABI616_14255 [Pseudomonadota bacterium]
MNRNLHALLAGVLGSLAACGSGEDTIATPPLPVPITGPAWPTFGGDAQHAALAAIASQPLSRILWQTPVDTAPQYGGGGSYLLTHYGSPVISSMNTLLIPVKTTAIGSFRIEARNGSSGALLWTAASDYLVPPHNWFPSYNLTLSSTNRLYAPGAGGKVYYRDNVDSAAGTLQTAVFYGAAVYTANQAALDAAIIINTPVTADAAGNVYFGFLASLPNVANLTSGFARLTASGTGTWVSASAAANDVAIDRPAMNSAPAMSRDGAVVYVAVSDAAGQGYLVGLDSATLAPLARMPLNDPITGAPAFVSSDGTASPTVGPDGDVFFGVLESNRPAHNYRGWLLHFNGALTQAKIPGGFGWDDTASIVPVSAVPSYAGISTYLVMTKYNNYGGAGTGDGKNRMAILDPGSAAADRITGNPTMAEVLTILGPTPDPNYPGGVKEWCVNTAVVDPLTKSVLFNSEDGLMYRWNLVTNTLSEQIRFTNGLGESYTPTALGPDGVVYAINNAMLFAAGR